MATIQFGVFLVILMTMTSPSYAKSIHVFMDLDGNGKADRCPNPAHRAHTPSDDFVTCGGSYDVDGDGVEEKIYCTPQAAVWNMAKSDTVEVHAGTYHAAGAYADADALDHSMGGGSGCDKQNCWFATVVAYGYGPHLDGTGYGTSDAPGILRGARMNNSSDTWDSNGNKIPDADEGVTSYPAIFSGDLNNNGTFDPTTGDDSSVDGDAFYAIQVGCNNETYDFCSSQHTDGVHVDTSGDGTFETIPKSGQKAVDYFHIEDPEFTKYNGENGSISGGVRAREGTISLEGIGNTDGLVVNHVYIHGNDYSLSASAENDWAYFSDSHNGGCSLFTEIKNSFIEQNNEKVMDDDCGVGNACGCPKNFHGNRV